MPCSKATTISVARSGAASGDSVSTNIDSSGAYPGDQGLRESTGKPEHGGEFRAPTLLNIEVTGPYTHAGAYATLDEVIRHYDNQDNTVENFFDDGGWCQLTQFEDVAGCAALYPDARDNTEIALRKVRRERNTLPEDEQLPQININNGERRDVIEFLGTLTDPCVLDPVCLAPWIADPDSAGPDGMQLNAVDELGDPL